MYSPITGILPEVNIFDLVGSNPPPPPTPPSLTSISPSSGNRGSVVTVHFIGTGFDMPILSIDAGIGIVVGLPQNITSTSFDATFTISDSAPQGAHLISVTTEFGTTNTVTFTVTRSHLTRKSATNVFRA